VNFKPAFPSAKVMNEPFVICVVPSAWNSVPLLIPVILKCVTSTPSAAFREITRPPLDWVSSSVVAFVTAIWLSLFALHLLSSVALPHYYLLWAPFSVLLAAAGLDRLLRDRPASATSPLTPLSALGLVGVALLAVAGVVGTANLATLRQGDYGRMAGELHRRGVTPTEVRYQGEAVDRYFRGVDAGQIGFSDPDAAFDVLVLDPRDVPMLGAGSADEMRRRAAAAGLTAHRIGRLEVWYR